MNYAPCKAVGQLKSAVNYALGIKKEQVAQEIVKTRDDLYNAFGCNRDNFANSILMTRKMHNKSYSFRKQDEILAHKMSISFHKEDSKNMSYEMAYKIGEEFARKFFYEKGYQALFVVHTDKEHTHIHFVVSNCSMENGKAYRRNKKELWEMSEYFGDQCQYYGLHNSVRDSFYNREQTRDKLTYNETQMRAKGKEGFKDELREAIQLELNSLANATFEDVIQALWQNYKIETRVAGNTVSYRHPEYKDKNGKFVSVRASKLGMMYTKGGIENEFNKRQNRANSQRNEGERNGQQRKQTGIIGKGTSEGYIARYSATKNEPKRSGNIEDTVRRTDLSSEQLQRQLSEIRGYNKQFSPNEQRKHDERIAREQAEHKRTKEVQRNIDKEFEHHYGDYER